MAKDLSKPRTTPWREKKPWKWEEDGLTVTRGNAWTGPGCHEGCGVLLCTNKEGKLVKVEGDIENPWNQGRLCLRCLALRDVVNHPDRLKYPMKRVGKRGENKWQRVSWDEALDTIAERLNKIKKEDGPESVIFCQGTGRDNMPYISRLASSFGSPNHTGFQSGIACFVPRLAMMTVTAGALHTVDASQYWPDRYDNPEWKAPGCIIVWGNNPVVSNPDLAYGYWTVDCMKSGSKLIVVDPRLTWLASRADLWLQIRPGTDAALALGMLNIIIKEKLYDEDFVEKWTYGFDKLAERAAEYPVERVAEITWIPKEKILAAARMFAKSKPGAVQWGVAVDMTKEAQPAGQAISALWEITGNVDVPGGMLPIKIPFAVPAFAGGWGTNLLSEEVKPKRIGLDKYPIFGVILAQAQPDEVVKTLETGKPYPIKAAWLQGSNALTCMSADPRRLYKALRTLETVVVVDLFMTPTAVALADFVLPANTYPERDSIRANWYNLQAINKVTQIGEAKSDNQIGLEMGKRLNPEAWPWENAQDMLTAMMNEEALNGIGTGGVTFKELRERGGTMYPPFEYKRYEKGLERWDGQPGFNTPTGRIELYSATFEGWGLDPLPYFEEPTESPYSTPELMKEYPLILGTGVRAWGLFHSEHRQIPSLRAVHPQPEIEINPETAAKYGIENGDQVWIENGMGKCRQRAKITPIVPPWMVNADYGWWFPEQEGAEPNLFGMWDVNINQLVPMLPGKSGYGANYKSLICKIYKVKEGEM